MFATLSVAVATGIKLVIGRWASADEDLLFLGAVATVALVTGARSSALAVILAAASQAYFFSSPRYSFAIDDPAKAIGLAAWTLEGFALCAVFARLEGLARRASSAANEARRSEVLMRRVFEVSPTPMFVVERDGGAFLAANDAALALYGYDRAHFLRLNVDELRAPQTEPDPLDDAIHHRRADGQTIDVDLSATPSTFAGKPVRIVVINERRGTPKAEPAVASSSTVRAARPGPERPARRVVRRISAAR